MVLLLSISDIEWLLLSSLCALKGNDSLRRRRDKVKTDKIINAATAQPRIVIMINGPLPRDSCE